MKIKLLIVDDSELITQAFSDFLRLQRPEWKTIRANSCREALELLSADAPDAALLDVFLGDGNGFDILSRLRNAEPRFPVIMMSGSGAGAFSELVPSEKNFRMLEKPFHMDTLIAAVERELNASCYVPGNGNGNGRGHVTPVPYKNDKEVYDLDYVANSSHPIIKSLIRKMEIDMGLHNDIHDEADVR